jgi:hypothetical protein
MRREDITILLASPTYNRSGDWGSAYGALLYPSKHFNVRPMQRGHSALCHNFNNLLNEALNENFTHFAMLHTDVVPEAGWLDKLMFKLEEMSADLISVVIPIKTPEGFTSTGIGNHDDPYNPIRRFTMKEIFELPETFTAHDAGYGGYPLLINTGCWVADLRNPMWTALDENGEARFSFQQINRRTLRDGKWVAEFEPEDWRLGKALHKSGARYYATRCVKLRHVGETTYSNAHAWGTYETDPLAKEMAVMR